MTGIDLFDGAADLSSFPVELLEGPESFVWKDMLLGLHGHETLTLEDCLR